MASAGTYTQDVAGSRSGDPGVAFHEMRGNPYDGPFEELGLYKSLEVLDGKHSDMEHRGSGDKGGSAGKHASAGLRKERIQDVEVVTQVACSDTSRLLFVLAVRSGLSACVLASCLPMAASPQMVDLRLRSPLRTLQPVLDHASPSSSFLGLVAG